MFTQAFVRKPSENFAQGLTTSSKGKPDFNLVLKQHAAYVNALEACGLKITFLPEAAEYPDAPFVEDTAVLFEKGAIIANPGAETRKGEVRSVAPYLKEIRQCFSITAPGSLDGGDVLQIGQTFFVGISQRTNSQGFEQFQDFTSRHGYKSIAVPVGAGLHLKSEVNALSEDTLLISSGFSGMAEFSDYAKIIVPENETYAANTLWINESLITPAGFPETRKLIEGLGKDVIEVEMSEFEKMDGGLTCLSLRFS